MDEAINRLKQLLSWSDRIGSDEIHEINEVIKLLENDNSLLEDSYTIVAWPESQNYMEEDWFKKEAILEVDGTFGSSAYFIPTKRL